MEYWISRNIVAAKAAPTETLYVIRYKVESFQRLLRFLRFLRLLTVSPYHPPRFSYVSSVLCPPPFDSKLLPFKRGAFVSFPGVIRGMLAGFVDF